MFSFFLVVQHCSQLNIKYVLIYVVKPNDLLFLLQMASSMPLSVRQQNDLQRTANPRLEVNERRLRPIYDFMEIHK